MTEREKLRALAAKRMRKARAALRAGQTLLSAELYEDSINRCYYAMFHAASALLLTSGLGASKHSGVLSLFDLHFVKPGIVSKDLSRWIHDAFEARQFADYAEDMLDPQTTATITVRHAEDFVAAVAPVLEGLLQELGGTSNARE